MDWIFLVISCYYIVRNALNFNIENNWCFFIEETPFDGLLQFLIKFCLQEEQTILILWQAILF